MGILNVCKVEAKVKPLKKDGTVGAEITAPFYFEGSSIYFDTAMATATGVECIPADKWDGSFPLTPVANLIRAGILERESVVVQATGGKKKRYSIVIDAEKQLTIRDGSAAEKLNGKSFVLKKGTTSTTVGTIIRVGGQTEAISVAR
jgi:hypothetical protein